MKKYIDEYFEKQGIRVIYNTLGHTDELVQVYVKETYNTFLNSKATFTNSIKSSLYNKFYPLKARDKKTGFEKLEKKDNYFRNIIVPTNMSDMWNSPSHTFDILKNDGESYVDCLKKHLLKIEDPLLFYSGGIDSELVLQTFLSTGIKPVVVIFEFTDTLGNVLNQYDILYATEFCTKNDIKPIVKRICPESLWDTYEFIKIGKELRIGSPQILTHIYMAKIMADEMPGMTYCFGGEIRYSYYNNNNYPNKVLVSSLKSFNPAMDAGPWIGTNAVGGVDRYINLISRADIGGTNNPSYRNTITYSSYSPVSPNPLDPQRFDGSFSDQVWPTDPFNYTFVISWSLTAGSDPNPSTSIDPTAAAAIAGSGNPFQPQLNGYANLNSQFLFSTVTLGSYAACSFSYTWTWTIYNTGDPGTNISVTRTFTNNRI